MPQRQAPDSIGYLATDLRVVRADNTSPLTGAGTNTYILGRGDVAIIDPGPDDPRHLQTILNSLPAGSIVRYVLVTHAHRDHSPLARVVADVVRAPVVAYGDASVGRSPLMQELAERIGLGGGEGVDHDFAPDRTLADGESLELGDARIEAIWTPGHFGNHMCFVWRGLAFTGDHVMGWASSLVSPPDGDLDAYMSSLHRLADVKASALYPGHGPPVTDPEGRIEELLAHRLSREAGIRAQLALGPRTIPDLIDALYQDTPCVLHAAAARNILAHLIALCARGHAVARPEIGPDATFSTA